MRLLDLIRVENRTLTKVCHWSSNTTRLLQRRFERQALVIDHQPNPDCIDSNHQKVGPVLNLSNLLHLVLVHGR